LFFENYKKVASFFKRLLQGAGNPSRSVTDYRIPRAIRKLELHDHPDKNEKSHAEIFEQLAEVYEVLLDKKKGSPAETSPVTSSMVIHRPSRRVLRFQRSGVRVLRRRLCGEIRIRDWPAPKESAGRTRAFYDTGGQGLQVLATADLVQWPGGSNQIHPAGTGAPE